MSLSGGVEAVSVVMDRADIYYSDLERVWKIAPNGSKSVAVPGVHTHELYVVATGRETCTGPSSPDAAVAESDIVVTCTTARAPILDAHHLHPGLFIATVGADNPEEQELAPAVLRDSRVVVDILEQAATMGDLHHALEAGAVAREDVHGELGDVICGRVRGRERDDEVFVFDSTGTALQDVALASLAYARASKRKVGSRIAFSR